MEEDSNKDFFFYVYKIFFFFFLRACSMLRWEKGKGRNSSCYRLLGGQVLEQPVLDRVHFPTSKREYIIYALWCLPCSYRLHCDFACNRKRFRSNSSRVRIFFLIQEHKCTANCFVIFHVFGWIL